ncbi:BRO-N domain-containing protein [Kosakonia oryziphila]|uniref:BRO family, N-terminal domain n=1 Tax=Kosakonia oryziphila TaxID=1005667 RepID=A0A1C4G207_9ENTR|nr:Bro-N domain-containing protein [Kosakonia oryziphila]SCC62210.1 BRO family, N-terminal domain [Kosakonia oryziphila]
MTNLMHFNSSELNLSLTGMLYKGKPVLDAVGLAKSLGYANPADALAKHCKSLIKINYSESRELGFGEKPRGIQLAGQADMFRLILRSQLPSAERVQDWVCEDVLPSIMETGSYGKSLPVAEPAPQAISMHSDILSLARVVAEATASATMKAVMEVASVSLVSAAPASPAAPQTRISTGTEMPNTDSEFVPVHKVSWETGLSDPSCRRLIQFASLPTRQLTGIRGLCVQREAFIHAFQVLLEESTRPSGKLKRWQHPEFGGFLLRKDPEVLSVEKE